MTVKKNDRSVGVLLIVEDNAADVRLLKEALRGSEALGELHVVQDGEEAMDFVRRTGVHADAPRPDLVLLDLNLPRKDGREVLAEIKADLDLKRIPVVVLTSSESDDDIYRVYDAGANSYVTKPIDLDEFVGVAQALVHFWLEVVKLPEDSCE